MIPDLLQGHDGRRGAPNNQVKEGRLAEQRELGTRRKDQQREARLCRRQRRGRLTCRRLK